MWTLDGPASFILSELKSILVSMTCTSCTIANRLGERVVWKEWTSAIRALSTQCWERRGGGGGEKAN